MTDLTKEQIHCLQHALGLDWKYYEFRNHYCTNRNDPDICALVDAGLMEWYEAQGSSERQSYASVTDAGRKVAWAHMPIKKAYECYNDGDEFACIVHAETASKARYDTYLSMMEYGDSIRLTDIKVRRCKAADRQDPYKAARELGLVS